MAAPYDASATHATAPAEHPAGTVQPKSLLRPQRIKFRAQQRRTPWDHVANIALWPLALGFILHRTIIKGVQATTTDDFRLVYEALRRFWVHEPLYAADYDSYAPHYLYTPGATVFLAPIAWTDDMSFARALFVVLNAAAIIVAIGIFTRLFGYSLRSFVFPLGVLVAFWTESVTNTLSFGNINGIMLAVFAGFLAATLYNKRWLAGVLLGILVLIKPVFAVLFFIPLALLWWQPIIVAVAIPVLFNIIGWKMAVEPHAYIDTVVPFLRETRDFANVSWKGVVAAFGLSGSVATAFWILFTLCAALGLLASLPWRRIDPLLWITATSSLLLVSGYFLSSLGQGYYSMFLFPVFFSICLRVSPARSAFAWIAFFGMFYPDSLVTWRWPIATYYLDIYIVAFAWAILLVLLSVFWLTRFWNAWQHRPALIDASQQAAPAA